MNFLQQNCRFGFYTQGKAALCKSFKCGDNDLDDFFTKDAFLQSEELLCKNYCFSLVDDPAQLVAVFTLSNDSIKKIPGSRKRKIEKNIPREKIYSSYPAVMIGRLGISLDLGCLVGTHFHTETVTHVCLPREVGGVDIELRL